MATASTAQSSTRPALFDAHCHIHDPRFCVSHQQQQVQQYEALRPVIRRAVAANVTHVASCACFESDWDALETLLAHWDREFNAKAAVESSVSDQNPSGRIQLVPSFGVHPWWAQERHDEYLELLRAKLKQYPTASLGEIGLCKSSRGRAVDFQVQDQVFREQLELAIELSRTCVIHCVGYYGKLLDILQATLNSTKNKKLPPRIVLHSYAGGADLAKSFLALEKYATGTQLYFSLNVKQLTDARSGKTAACCAAVPLRTLLLETDAPDQVPLAAAVKEVSKEFGSFDFSFEDTLAASYELNEPALVSVAYARAAEIRQLPLVDLATAVYQNSLAAFGVNEEWMMLVNTEA